MQTVGHISAFLSSIREDGIMGIEIFKSPREDTYEFSSALIKYTFLPPRYSLFGRL